jgi:[acyl-carrier-protein] S-malonyltransferase
MQLACMFPGQGSQSVGMLNTIYQSDSIVMDTFSEAKSVLNIDFWSMIENGPEQLLNDTINTQVVMLIADVAMYRFLIKQGMPKPQMMAGHSLGEYAALVCAGAIEFSDALRLVRKRAELMQAVVQDVDGAMAAIIGLDNSVVEEICHHIALEHPEQVLEPANYNAPGQLVIAGHRQLIELAVDKLNEAGARMTKILPVSIPCHCKLMEPAARDFYVALLETSMHIPHIPLISNVDLSIYDSVDTIKEILAKQLYKPVRWTETLDLFKTNHVNVLMECGPGKVLSGLAKRTVPDIKTLFCFEINQLPEWDAV